jgi:hypothetical protein
MNPPLTLDEIKLALGALDTLRYEIRANILTGRAIDLDKAYSAYSDIESTLFKALPPVPAVADYRAIAVEMLNVFGANLPATASPARIMQAARRLKRQNATRKPRRDVGDREARLNAVEAGL